MIPLLIELLSLNYIIISVCICILIYCLGIHAINKRIVEIKNILDSFHKFYRNSDLFIQKYKVYNDYSNEKDYIIAKGPLISKYVDKDFYNSPILTFYNDIQYKRTINFDKQFEQVRNILLQKSEELSGESKHLTKLDSFQKFIYGLSWLVNCFINTDKTKKSPFFNGTKSTRQKIESFMSAVILIGTFCQIVLFFLEKLNL